jgi:predicted RNase H-like nuclease
MTTIAGADGCRSGWICLFLELETGRLGSKIFESTAALLDQAEHVDVLAIDIPIGLTDAGPRECDVAARRMLRGPRASSVFPAPIRPALAASTYAEGLQIAIKAQGKGFSKQAWAIYPKIREVDQQLRIREKALARVIEVHPEVSFAAWNSGAAIQEPKKTRDGARLRQALIAARFGDAAFATVRARYLRRIAADDDIADAFAGLWTAERVLNGSASTLPATPPIDTTGLPMQIVF